MYKPSNKQKAQRKRFAFKGGLIYIDRLLSYYEKTIPLSSEEKIRLDDISVNLYMLIRYVDSYSDDVIYNTKNKPKEDKNEC
jgi:hypothetical protein